MTPSRPTLGLATAALLFLLDQASKWLVMGPLQLPERGHIDLLPIFDLTWVENYGISLGLFTAGSDAARWALVAITSVIAIGVAWWMTREPRRGDQIALGMVLGGALGNILDRARLGYVADFADLHVRWIPERVCPSYVDGMCRPFLIFNVADAAISLGVLALILRAFLIKDASKTPAHASQGE
jgi:signal peptidase II